MQGQKGEGEQKLEIDYYQSAYVIYQYYAIYQYYISMCMYVRLY